MTNHKYIITISGQTPSKKNQKQIVKSRATGKPLIISSKIHNAWEKEALKELTTYVARLNEGRLQIDYMFYMKDNRKRDLDNLVASINDVLIKSGIIIDDCWQMLRIGSADAEIDKENPRCTVSITAL